MLTYLALGDSYTIGEQCETKDNFPNQLQQMLADKHHFSIAAPHIIATTGWTTGELIEATNQETLQEKYDIVTLLIGVNNQYRNLDIDIFKKEFTDLLEFAINHSKNGADGVFVLSIPDWGVTPFAQDKNREEIAQAIDMYNLEKEKIAKEYGCDFTNITDSTRINGINETYLVEDKLHYNANEYKIWAERLLPKVASIFAL